MSSFQKETLSAINFKQKQQYCQNAFQFDVFRDIQYY